MKSKVTVLKETCKSCELCIRACPKNVLGLMEDYVNQKGYHPAAAIKEEACIACGLCITVCPDVAIRVEKE